MKMPDIIDAKLFAPCGINCLACYAHLKEKRPCPGCLHNDNNKPAHCRICKINSCAQGKELTYCYECIDFPCKLISNLEKSYLKRYNTSLIENSKKVQRDGINDFLSQEHDKWICKICSGVISLHDGKCSDCGARY